MRTRTLEEVKDLMKQTDKRWSDKSYIASLRLNSMLVELFNLFLINTAKIIPDCKFDKPWNVLKNNGSIIIAMWHGSLFGPLYFLREKQFAPMASLSKDGDLITKVLDFLGFQTIRGSSSRGGARALLEAVDRLKKGTTVIFTVDGPKGPFHEVKPGIIKLSQKTGVPIVPIGMAYGKSISLHSWDKMQIPLPFSKSVLHIGKPVKIESGVSIEDGCRLLQSRLCECEQLAMEKLKAGC